MTFTELFRMTNEKTSEIPVTASNSSNPSSRPEADFCELVWENGQIMMQGQSSKSRTHNSQDVDGLRMNKFSAMDSALIEMGLGNDADIPWLSYPVEDSLQNDYSCDFLPELSGVTINDLPTDNNSAFREKNRSSNMLKPDILRSGVSGVSGDIGSTQDVTSQGFDTSSVAAFTNLRLQKLDPVRQPSTSTSFTNFPYFARPASLARANLVAVNTSENYERGTSTDSMVVNLELDSTKKTLNEENCVNDFQQSHSIDAMKGNEVGMSVEKNKEPVVATTTSVCSANSVDKASNERARDLKRKSRESTESEGPSNEFEDESIGAKKAAHARASSKRSRAAEVHNLSERKRRDRINEKMRALQELIPNCNKVDKASMLDEAIEYLKTLQLQVQMMSMGAGMYMQPMMVPPGLPHFSPMRLGMGFGMNMFGPTHYPVPGGAAPFQGPSLPPYGHPYQGSPMSTHPIIPGVPPPPLNSAMMGLSVSDLAACSRASNLCANDSTQQIRTSSIPNNSMNQATKEGIHPSHSTQDRRPNVNASESPPTAGRTNNVAYTSCHHTKPQKHSMAEIFSPQDMKVDRASGVFPVITSLPGCSSMT